ncbi:MAG TPA: hypothetical protein ENH10_03635, partial [Bacteroidetes bacterium]|nr:hypothetical protein [Bacteroidota bacterium]HEX04234.1 hypothetical protein [Bacteroidota bacterium]
MLKRWLLVAVLSVALSTMYLVGCSNEDDPDGPGDTNDTTAANQAVQQGNEILADVLFEMINTEPEEISDVDITEAYGYYQDAIVADSDNPGGHFGMGILEVFTLTQDAETQQFFDNMKEYWSGDSWFLEEGGNPAPFANTGAYGRSGVSYIIAGPLVMMKGMSGISEEYGHSTGDMQQFARDKLIPLITSAVNHLLVVATYQDFVFMVTPEMQGDLYEDAVELDLTEVHATIAALSSMEALLQ